MMLCRRHHFTASSGRIYNFMSIYGTRNHLLQQKHPASVTGFTSCDHLNFAVTLASFPGPAIFVACSTNDGNGGAWVQGYCSLVPRPHPTNWKGAWCHSEEVQHYHVRYALMSIPRTKNCRYNSRKCFAARSRRQDQDKFRGVFVMLKVPRHVAVVS